jgi:hypothetical protein
VARKRSIFLFNRKLIVKPWLKASWGHSCKIAIRNSQKHKPPQAPLLKSVQKMAVIPVFDQGEMHKRCLTRQSTQMHRIVIRRLSGNHLTWLAQCLSLALSAYPSASFCALGTLQSNGTVWHATPLPIKWACHFTLTCLLNWSM